MFIASSKPVGQPKGTSDVSAVPSRLGSRASHEILWDSRCDIVPLIHIRHQNLQQLTFLSDLCFGCPPCSYARSSSSRGTPMLKILGAERAEIGWTRTFDPWRPA